MPNKHTSNSFNVAAGSPKPKKRRNPYTANQPLHATPPVPQYKAYYYQRNLGTTHAVTPGGTENDIRDEIGRAHQHIKSPAGTTYIEGSFPDQTTPHGRFGALVAELTCLKARVDKDYNSKSVDEGHCIYAKKQIARCIAWMRQVFNEDPNTLVTLNKAILDGTLYNPFGLEPIYKGCSYNVVAAENVVAFTSKITRSELVGISFVKASVIDFSLFPKSITEVPEQNTPGSDAEYGQHKRIKLAGKSLCMDLS